MPSRLRRRTLLQLGLATAAVAATDLRHLPGALAADEFDALRLRWLALSTGGAIDPADPVYATGLARLSTDAVNFRDTMLTSADRTALWPDLPLSSASGNFSISYTRLRTMALARATRGTAVTDDQAVGELIVSALDFLHAKAYNETKPETGNWWFWEIGAPRALTETCVFAYDVLDATRVSTYLKAVDRFVPDPNRRTNSPNLRETGANRVDKAVIVALRGILGRTAAKVVAARDALSDVAEAGRNSVFKYVESGDGFYRDGSFIQHGNLAYVGTYGNVALSGVANLFYLLGGSSWEITDPNRVVILDAVEASFAPFMSNGLMMDCVSGRAISRERAGDHRHGHGTTSSVLLLAGGVEEPYASRFRRLAKDWISSDRLNDYLAEASIPEIARAKAVLADPAVRPLPEALRHDQFHNQDRVVHRRPGWTFAIAMSSRRMARYEWGNGENLRGWYVGDGMTYLYNDDHGQFNDAFWPTVDAMKLPGTTVSTRQRAPHAGTSGTGTIAAYADWVGGASYRGVAGAVGMHLINHDKSVQARKSWFCVSDAVVALGAGIIGTDGHPVATIVENRNLHADGTDALVIDGAAQPMDHGWTAEAGGATWAHLEGTGGYLFPNGGDLHARREERTGSWREINTGNDTGGSTTPHSRRYLSLWLDHGSNPTAAGYAYVLLPGATIERTAELAADSGFEILANSATVQAIRAARDRLTLANFWTVAAAGGITTTGPASVVVGLDPGMLHVAVSDPSRTQQTVRVTIDVPARTTIATDPAVTVVATGRRLVLDVAVGGTRGATHTASFTRS
ncbi:polysaccharide lyase 8 family protein [Kribbella deserti]|uniref:Polysaccharide lyase 8 family protein n=1 Tax=Kribbella deserti TaxID=1926257 RepID=A0ABV6QNQ7_9ACTN